MHTSNHILFLASSLLAGLGTVVSARDVPENIKTFYNQLAAQGTCKNKLADGFFSTDEGPGGEWSLSLSLSDSHPPIPIPKY